MWILLRSSKVAGAITPVPGGVGPLTIAMLLRNTLSAAQCWKRSRFTSFTPAAFFAGRFNALVGFMRQECYLVCAVAANRPLAFYSQPFLFLEREGSSNE